MRSFTAFAATNRKGFICLRAKKIGRFVDILVADNGIGMNAETLWGVFNREPVASLSLTPKARYLTEDSGSTLAPDGTSPDGQFPLLTAANGERRVGATRAASDSLPVGGTVPGGEGLGVIVIRTALFRAAATSTTDVDL